MNRQIVSPRGFFFLFLLPPPKSILLNNRRGFYHVFYLSCQCGSLFWWPNCGEAILDHYGVHGVWDCFGYDEAFTSRSFGGTCHSFYSSGHSFWIVIFARTGDSPQGKYYTSLSLPVSFSCTLLHHQDIKADNILVDSLGIAKLADFGTSQRVSTQGDLELSTHAGGGTMAFMAPEVVRGQVCAKSDVFSLGITIMQMAEGHSPYEELPPLQLSMEISSDDPVPPLKVRSARVSFFLPFFKMPLKKKKDGAAWSDGLKELLRTCVAKDLKVRASVSTLLKMEVILNAPVREKCLLPFAQEVVQARKERREQEEREQRRALVGARK